MNRPLNNQAPYVGSSAFAHKAGLHVSAIARARTPTSTSTRSRSATAPASSCPSWPGGPPSRSRPSELGLPIDGAAVGTVIDELKRLEHEGYHFEAADASLELLMRRAAGWEQDFFTVESMRVIADELPERLPSSPRPP